MSPMGDAVKRWLFLALGVLFTLGGIVGMFLPVVPTVPQFLVALWAFSKSSRRLHDWLLHHPKLGIRLREWQEHQAIALRTKIVAVAAIAMSAVWVAFFSAAPWWAMALSLAFMGYGAWFILSRPTLRD